MTGPSSIQRDAELTRRTYLVGVALVLAAALMWSLNGALIKLVYEDGQGPSGITIAFYRSLFAGLCLLPLARGKLHTLQEPTGRRRPWRLKPAAVWCVIFFALMTVCFVVANVNTEAANAIILQYTSTFWVFGLSPWILKERPCLRDLWILGLAIVGIAIIFFGNAATDLFGLVNALGSGLFYGLLTMMIRRLRDSDSAAVTVFNNLGSAVLILPFLLVMGALSGGLLDGLRVSPRAGLLLVIMGVVQFGIPYYLFSLGLVRLVAYQAALITMAEPIFVPVWTYLAVGETVSTWTVVGGGVVFAALIIFLLAASRSRKVIATVRKS